MIVYFCPLSAYELDNLIDHGSISRGGNESVLHLCIESRFNDKPLSRIEFVGDNFMILSDDLSLHKTSLVKC